jgi:hypothetical protein
MDFAANDTIFPLLIEFDCHMIAQSHIASPP